MLSRKPFVCLTWPIVAAAVLLGLVGTVAAGFVVLEYFLRTYDERLALLQARHHVEQTHRLVATIESAFRGYVLTQQSEFLVPMAEAEAELDRAFADLRWCGDEFPDLREDFQMMDVEIRMLLLSKRRLLLDVYSRRDDRVLSYVRSGEGHTLSTGLRQKFEAVGSLLEARERQLQETGWVKTASRIFSRTWQGLTGVGP